MRRQAERTRPAPAARVRRRDPSPNPAASAGVPRPVLLGLALLSAGILAYELAFTRIFSLLLSYHFVFLVVSLALVAPGLAGFALHLAGPGRRPPSLAGGSALASAVAAVAVLFLLARLPWVNVVLYGMLLLAPILLAAMAQVAIFDRFAWHSARLYAVDLFGAAMGTAAALAMLGVTSPVRVVLVAAAGGAAAAACLAGLSPVPGRGRTYRLAAGALLALLLVAAYLYAPQLETLQLSDKIGAPLDKTMIRMLRDPDQDARILYTAWGLLGRADVVATRDSSRRYVFTDAGAGMVMYGDTADAVATDDAGVPNSLAVEPAAALLSDGPRERVLSIGPGGGKDILLSLQAGARQIDAAEINPAVVQAVRAFADYNGGILDRAGVNLAVADGRSYMTRSQAPYDAILLDLVFTQAAEPGSHALAENYIFTVEAFRSYLAHLRPGGRLIVVAHSLPEGVRVFETGARALAEEYGLSPADVRQRLVLLAEPEGAGAGQQTTAVAVQREPLDEDAAAALAEAAHERDLLVLFMPHLLDAELPAILQYLGVDIAAYDLRPVTDDRPFFFHLNRELPESLQQLLWLAALLGCGGLALAVAVRLDAPLSRPQRAAGLGYFGAVAMGFVAIEVTLTQQAALLLGNPTYAFAIVVLGLLCGGGLGSLWLARSGSRVGMQGWPLLGIAGVLGLWLLAGPEWLARAAGHGVLPSAGLLLMVCPLGFLMGMPFPAGLRAWAALAPRGLPLAWGVNGLLALLGSSLAAAISLLQGFRATLVFAVGAYLVALAFGRVLAREVSDESLR